MNATYRVIRPKGPPTVHKADLPAKPKLDQLKEVILPHLGAGATASGGAVHMERVRVLHDDGYTDMFVDEDGISKRLPVNKVATKIYRANWLRQYPRANPDELPAIYGTAVLFVRRVWF